MVARRFPEDKKKLLGNRSMEELQKMLRERSSSKPLSGTIDVRKVPGSNERRTGIPADTRSRSQRGSVPPGQILKKTTPAQSDSRTLTPVKPNTLNPRMAPKTPVPGDRGKVRPALVAKKNPLKNPVKPFGDNAIMRRLRKRYKLNVT